jgi:site-specific DNA-cytosine methylase
VPGNVDLLVAGTSCVDYSNLNNEKQGLEAKGESGETFRGMMRWVTSHSPPIVILENVKGAPWAAVCKKFEEVGYSAQSCYLDTKKYYIPHTRQRGYLIAVHQKHSKVAEKWKSRVADMARPASSSLDSFLLPTDDPRIHQAREKLAKESYNAADRRTGRTDWAKCQQRHERERVGGQLGLRRPLTHWEDGEVDFGALLQYKV